MLLVYPPVAVAVRLERLGRLRPGLFDRRTALPFIERECGNIDKRRNVWMIAGLGDDGPPITVTHQNHWSAHGVDGGLGVLLVLGVGGLGGLRHRHLVPIILEDVSDGFPARAIGECTVHQNHVLDVMFRFHVASFDLNFELLAALVISTSPLLLRVLLRRPRSSGPPPILATSAEAHHRASRLQPAGNLSANKKALYAVAVGPCAAFAPFRATSDPSVRVD